MLRILLRCQSLASIQKRCINILGIETSCDDTAVCIINNQRKVLSALTFTDRHSQIEQGGISPLTAAQQHRDHLARLVDECFTISSLSPEEITAVAVTTTPGLVIALKEGIKSAICFAKKYRKPLIPVHHMRAHALAAFLISSDLDFPFLSVLISGGHAIFVLVDGYYGSGESKSGSPGECLDKVARELKISEIPSYNGIHPGAAMEILASQASPCGHLRYTIKGPSVLAADMNFSQLKSSLLGALRKVKNSSEFSLEDFCASAQYQVARHICTRFNSVLETLQVSSRLPKHVVVGGGVASNRYITNAIQKLSSSYGLSTVMIPRRLCTDNAEMVALTGLLKFEHHDIFASTEIPETIYAHARSEIGEDVRHWLPTKSTKTLSGPSLHGDKSVYIYTKDDFKNK